jgi:hypothetical protein
LARERYRVHKATGWDDLLLAVSEAIILDTAAFERQPKGAGTIFLLWASNNGRKGGGYVELPYTFLQDLTLFVLQ